MLEDFTERYLNLEANNQNSRTVRRLPPSPVTPPRRAHSKQHLISRVCRAGGLVWVGARVYVYVRGGGEGVRGQTAAAYSPPTLSIVLHSAVGV